MTLKSNREPLLYYVKLCLSFQSHLWIKTWVTVRKRSIQVKISNFLSSVTLKFDGSLWKTIGHLFYAASNWSYSPELPNLGQNQGFSRVTYKNLMEDLDKQQGTSPILRKAMSIISKPLANSNLSYSPETLYLGQNWPFLSCVTLKFDGWPWKTTRHIFYATSSFGHHFKAIGEFKL